jgi:hypothetical protein
MSARFVIGLTALLFVCEGAPAAMVDVTISGTLGGTQSDLLVTPGNYSTGEAFTWLFSYDDSSPVTCPDNTTTCALNGPVTSTLQIGDLNWTSTSSALTFTTGSVGCCAAGEAVTFEVTGFPTSTKFMTTGGLYPGQSYSLELMDLTLFAPYGFQDGYRPYVQQSVAALALGTAEGYLAGDGFGLFDIGLNITSVATNGSPYLPLPAGVWLLLTGLGGLGAFMRRRVRG